jgi:hypothetical protein
VVLNNSIASDTFFGWSAELVTTRFEQFSMPPFFDLNCFKDLSVRLIGEFFLIKVL